MNRVDCLALFKCFLYIENMELDFVLNENRRGYKTDVMIKLMCIHYFLITIYNGTTFYVERERVCVCVCVRVHVHS